MYQLRASKSVIQTGLHKKIKILIVIECTYYEKNTLKCFQLKQLDLQLFVISIIYFSIMDLEEEVLTLMKPSISVPRFANVMRM